jgi:hypothetical protein
VCLLMVIYESVNLITSVRLKVEQNQLVAGIA